MTNGSASGRLKNIRFRWIRNTSRKKKSLPDEDDWPPLEGDDLPGATRLAGPVAHHLPVLLVGRHLRESANKNVGKKFSKYNFRTMQITK
jgi:hypothetical protein